MPITVARIPQQHKKAANPPAREFAAQNRVQFSKFVNHLLTSWILDMEVGPSTERGWEGPVASAGMSGDDVPASQSRVYHLKLQRSNSDNSTRSKKRAANRCERVRDPESCRRSTGLLNPRLTTVTVGLWYGERTLGLSVTVRSGPRGTAWPTKSTSGSGNVESMQRMHWRCRQLRHRNF